MTKNNKNTVFAEELINKFKPAPLKAETAATANKVQRDELAAKAQHIREYCSNIINIAKTNLRFVNLTISSVDTECLVKQKLREKLNNIINVASNIIYKV